MRIIDPKKEDFPIRPADIATDKHAYDAFGHYETEVSAHWIVMFFQSRGGKKWEPFTFAELNEFYRNERGHPNAHYSFNNLYDERQGPQRNFVVKQGGKFFVTDEFVCRCYMANGIPRKKGGRP